jgi:hypothetical protein
VAAGASRRALFHLRLPNYLASKEKSGVAGFCSIMVKISSHLESYRPSSGRAGCSLCYSHVLHFKTFALSVLFY